MNVEYLQIRKNKQDILINLKDDPNAWFWRDSFQWWEAETFETFDENLDQSKVMIDLGGWIGTTCIYAARLSKHVYVVEPDPESIPYLERNCKDNMVNNVTLIREPVFNKSDIDVVFGANKHIGGSKLNQSTSQIVSTNLEDNSNGGIVVKTVTLDDILTKNSIHPEDIALIKVDIEGGEEHILEDLFAIKNKCPSIKLYISFHYTWWVDKNLKRYRSLLSDSAIKLIQKDPFCSILF